jgi:hypothetical protein
LDVSSIAGLYSASCCIGRVDSPYGSSLNEVLPRTSAQILNEFELDYGLLENFDCVMVPQVSTSRGCPGRCVFCSSVHGRKNRSKSAPQLLEDLHHLDDQICRDHIKVPVWRVYSDSTEKGLFARLGSYICLVDDDFLLDRKRSLEFLTMFAKSDLRKRYRLHMQTNPISLLVNGNADEELFALLEELRIYLQLGVESLNDEVLRRWKKRHRGAHVRVVLDRLSMVDSDYDVNILLADYLTTEAEIRTSLRLLFDEAVVRPRMRIMANGYRGFVHPIEGSELRRRIEERHLGAKTMLEPYSEYLRLIEEHIAACPIRPLVFNVAEKLNAASHLPSAERFQVYKTLGMTLEAPGPL